MLISIGFLFDEYKYFNIKNPYYPSLQQWMLLDGSTNDISAVYSDLNCITKDIETKPEASPTPQNNEEIENQVLIAQEAVGSQIQTTKNENSSASVVIRKVKKASQRTTENSSIQKHPKNRKRTLLTPKRNGLKNRRDVVNKSLLRAMRRFFMVEWNKSKPALRTKSEFKKSKLFKESVKDLVSKLIESCLNPEIVRQEIKALNQQSEGCYEELYQIIGCFIHRENYMKALNTNEIKEYDKIQQFLESFDKCCRFYSHIHFEELAKCKYFEMVFKIFAENINYIEMLGHSTIATNVKTYKQAIEEIQSKF